MSQKKLKKIRKEEISRLGNNQVLEKISGIREILILNWKFLLILCLGVIAIYFNGMWGGFVSDDYASITQNPDIKNFSWAIKTMSVPAMSNHLLAVIFGIESPILYHVFNLILYLLILIFGFVFIFLITSNKTVSMLTLIIYSVLPVHVESVSWISGRPYLFVALFVLILLDLLILLVRKKQFKYFWWMLPILCLLFFTDRIRGFSFVILSIIYFLTYSQKIGLKIKFRKVFGIAILITILMAVISWPMINTRIESVNSGVNASESIFYDPLFQYPTAIPKYLQLILFPTDLTLYHTMYILPVWLNWLIVLTYLTAVIWFWFKNKNIFFGLIFIFAASAPSMAPVKVSWLVAERYVFFGSLGMALVLALYFERWWNKRKILTIISVSVLCVLYSIRIILRNIDWQTNHNLWVNTCQVSPNSHNAWNNIGDDYDKLANLETTEEGKLGHYFNSIKGFGQSYAVKPNYADAYHNQANIFYKIGRLDLARNAYETAVKLNPNLFQTYLTLLQIDLAEKNESELLRHLEIIQTMKPNDLQVAYISAISYAQIGRVNEAKQLADMMYKQFPNILEIINLYDSLINIQATDSATLIK